MSASPVPDGQTDTESERPKAMSVVDGDFVNALAELSRPMLERSRRMFANLQRNPAGLDQHLFASAHEASNDLLEGYEPTEVIAHLAFLDDEAA